MRPGPGPWPAGMTVRFGRVEMRARTSRSAFPSPPVAARLAALPAGPSRLTPRRNGPGPPQRPSPPRTLSARPAAPPPSSPRALPKPLRPTLQQPQPHSCVPPSVLPGPAAGRLPVGSAPAVPHAKPSVRETQRLLALWWLLCEPHPSGESRRLMDESREELVFPKACGMKDSTRSQIPQLLMVSSLYFVNLFTCSVISFLRHYLRAVYSLMFFQRLDITEQNKVRCLLVAFVL